MEDKILTSQKHELAHKHMEKEQGELLEVSKVIGEQIAAQILTPDTFEIKNRPTRCYNCHGLAFANGHGWVTNPEVALVDDFVGVTGTKQEGDVVLYLRDALLTHSAIAVEVKDGEIVRVRSKWGEAAEMVHLIKEVPSVYGIPAVFMRRVGQATAPDTKCPEVDTPAPLKDEATAAAAPPDSINFAELAAPLSATPAASSLEVEADESGAPLMLASSPEVRDRIVREQVGARRAGTQPAGTFSMLGGASHADAAPPAVAVAVDESAIDEQFSKLLDPTLHLQLILASTSSVARRIITSLPPVKTLTEMAKVPNPAPVQTAIGSAALRFFQEHEAKSDDKLTSILLLLIKNFPVKEAAAPLALYLLNRKPVGLARNLAAEAFTTVAVM